MHVDSLPILAGMALSVGGFFLWLLVALLQPDLPRVECADPEDCQKEPSGD
ncbi:hypothetical protein BH10CYA1_BH10CYA1_53320 [soil metagenome]